jgi:hypothetical protein
MGAVFGFALFAFILCLLPLAIAVAFNVAARMDIPSSHILMAEVLFVSVLHTMMLSDSSELRFELLFGLFSHLCYLSNLANADFPSIEFYSKRSAISLLCFIVTHIIWFGYFSEVIMEDPVDLIMYYVIMIWLVPLSMVLVGLPKSKFSDASSDHVLPLYNANVSSECLNTSSKQREQAGSSKNTLGLVYTSSTGNSSSSRNSNTNRSIGSSSNFSNKTGGSMNSFSSRPSSSGYSSRGLTGLASTSSSSCTQAGLGGLGLRSHSRSDENLPSAALSAGLAPHTAAIPRSLSFTDLLGGANSI